MATIEIATGQLWGGVVGIVVLLGIIQWLATTWLKARIEQSIQHEYAKILEEYKWQLKIREKAESVAEYLSLAQFLKSTSTEQDYRQANKLSWELAMWLPEEIYEEMTRSIHNPTEEKNAFTTIVSVRQLLLKENAGQLDPEKIAFHAPGAGKK